MQGIIKSTRLACVVFTVFIWGVKKCILYYRSDLSVHTHCYFGNLTALVNINIFLKSMNYLLYILHFHSSICDCSSLFDLDCVAGTRSPGHSRPDG